MRSRTLALMLGLFFAGCAQLAQAGVIRSAGQDIAAGGCGGNQVAGAGGAALADGTASAGHTALNYLKTGVNTTENGVGSATGKAAAAGSSAGGSLVNGASDVAHTVKAAPAAAARETHKGVRGLWHFVW
jgi:hypothetical protein